MNHRKISLGFDSGREIEMGAVAGVEGEVWARAEEEEEVEVGAEIWVLEEEETVVAVVAVEEGAGLEFGLDELLRYPEEKNKKRGRVGRLDRDGCRGRRHES
ncbi:MAG: hypothetical protein Q4A79_03135 [Candidatus Saccharibacteria bacterium]|nr:hypothetical protein [Candidatus Saccharibacteria bacterium]